MDTGLAEILLIWTPAPGRERALAGPRARAALRCEARPGGQPALAKAAHGRASDGQWIVVT